MLLKAQFSKIFAGEPKQTLGGCSVKKFCSLALSFLFLVCLLVNQSLACTTFCLKSKDEVLFGRDYDWTIGDALVFVNKRGVMKTATVEDSPRPAKWISKYGSVTFNQYGRELPAGGMNEAGLVIEQLWLSETQYPKADSRPTVGTQEWIQYQLDNSATAQEVIKNAEKVRITSDVKVHYLATDKAGDTATIEFLNGKLITHEGASIAVPALTNDTYENSLNYSKTISIEKATTSGSLDRFTRAAQMTKEFERQPRSEQEAVDYAFEILSNAAQKDGAEKTQWSIVYDQKRGKIYFRTLQSPRIKMVDTKSFDYSCGTAVKMFDANSKESGDVTAKFTDYTRKANRDLIERSFNGTDFLKSIPAQARDFVAAYPERFTCRKEIRRAKRPLRR
jgi:penicillin V acylase-like amidase (Ntn superfamily)